MQWRFSRDALKGWIQSVTGISTQWEDEPRNYEEARHILLGGQVIQRVGTPWVDRENDALTGLVREFSYQEKRLILSVKLRTYDATKGLDAASELDGAIAALRKHGPRGELLKEQFTIQDVGDIQTPGFIANGVFYPQANTVLTLSFIDCESEESLDPIETVTGTVEVGPFDPETGDADISREFSAVYVPPTP